MGFGVWGLDTQRPEPGKVGANHWRNAQLGADGGGAEVVGHGANEEHLAVDGEEAEQPLEHKAVEQGEHHADKTHEPQRAPDLVAQAEAVVPHVFGHPRVCVDYGRGSVAGAPRVRERQLDGGGVAAAKGAGVDVDHRLLERVQDGKGDNGNRVLVDGQAREEPAVHGLQLKFALLGENVCG